MKKFLTAILVAAALLQLSAAAAGPPRQRMFSRVPRMRRKVRPMTARAASGTGLYAVGSLSSSASAGEEDGLDPNGCDDRRRHRG